MSIGQRVTFEHGAFGTMSGTIVKIYKNGKAQVECEPRISGDIEGIRKTMYNIKMTDLVPIQH